MQNRSGNQNHPAKGSTISVEPIRTVKDIRLIKAMLKGNPRDYALFVVGINTNLRASDLLRLTSAQVIEAKEGDEITLKEKKTGKHRRITLNKACIAAIQPLIRQMQDNGTLELDGPLFRGRKGGLIVSSLSRLVKKWCTDANLKGNYASHTLRKTWGYHQRKTFRVPLPVLMECFNHSTQKQTMDYLCIQPEEVKAVYENVL